LYGNQLFDKVRGEFAVLIYDKDREELEVFTDPFLTKPIFQMFFKLFFLIF
jgi:asparagine synthetase B (glutamine-hydrolysing)